MSEAVVHMNPLRTLLGARGLITRWPTSDKRDRTVTRTVTVLAGLAALFIAVAPPVTYMLAEGDRLLGALETSARLHAAQVAIMSQQNPNFWEFDGVRISAPDPDQGAMSVPERRRVYHATGRLVIESSAGAELAWPVFSQRAPIMDGGRLLGEAEASRSFRRGLLWTAAIALASMLGAALIFLVLRIVPLRLLNNALDRASYLSAHDVLTGLPNRALFADRLDQALSQARRTGQAAALLCIDLDHFREINDTLGHAAGDLLLCMISERLQGCLRDGDTVARLGGDEFAVIQPDAGGMEKAEVLARRLCEMMRLPMKLDGKPAQISASIGIALSEQQIESARLLRNADMALYRAKEKGRGQWCFFAPEMNAWLLKRRALESDLRVAIANSQFFLHYQPQVELQAQRIVGAEALLRWDRPGFGLMPPGGFIGLAEETGLIGSIGAWVLQEACRTAAGWPENIGIAVNVSPAQFRLSNFPDTVVEALRQSGLAAPRLQLEITEGILLSDTVETLRILDGLRAMGVRLAMDDFGTGYSSLESLQRFRFDTIKIDRQFIRNMASDPSAVAIVKAVIAMSRAMGIATIAEGVETRVQANMLIQEGCWEAQGYLYGRPMIADAFAGTLLGSHLTV